MQVSPQGVIKSFEFSNAVIHSHARLTYDQVAAAIFDNNDKAVKAVKPVKDDLENLKLVYQALAKARKKRHAIEFETREVVFKYNDQRKIDAIEPVERNQAHMLIEECMVAANISAAKLLKKKKIPTLYRIHEGPNADKLPNLAEFLLSFGIKLPSLEPTPADYADIIDQARARPEFDMIQTVILRSMLQASYSPDTKVGHFGLALNDYAHFTSPIRRYPDLLVHRAIKHWISQGSNQGYIYNLATMTALGETCSRNERRADDATRDAADWLKCEFLQKHIGKQYSGIVSGVTSFGLFVQIDDLLIDGLVHVTSLKRDYYHFDAAHHRLVGELTNRSYQLGDRLMIEVVRVDMEERKIDFDLVATLSSNAGKPFSSKRKGRSKKQPDKTKGSKSTTKKARKKTASGKPAKKKRR
ncbi:MAG: VacB/RNase II family 3'-5' exoribonuclease, partial [Gammaproteobacteria bacterium]|nr:VacB/RNase II family 3'-5' exoribonuclease [Gammaproteobacteria bacterium]